MKERNQKGWLLDFPLGNLACHFCSRTFFTPGMCNGQTDITDFPILHASTWLCILLCSSDEGSPNFFLKKKANLQFVFRINKIKGGLMAGLKGDRSSTGLGLGGWPAGGTVCIQSHEDGSSHWVMKSGVPLVLSCEIYKELRVKGGIWCGRSKVTLEALFCKLRTWASCELCPRKMGGDDTGICLRAVTEWCPHGKSQYSQPR